MVTFQGRGHYMTPTQTNTLRGNPLKKLPYICCFSNDPSYCWWQPEKSGYTPPVVGLVVELLWFIKASPPSPGGKTRRNFSKVGRGWSHSWPCHGFSFFTFSTGWPARHLQVNKRDIFVEMAWGFWKKTYKIYILYIYICIEMYIYTWIRVCIFKYIYILALLQ